MAVIKLHPSSFCLWLLVLELQGWFWWVRDELSNRVYPFITVKIHRDYFAPG